ncbi:MAG: S9 family peptidase, partial [Pseudomonadota bacterium]
GEYKLIWFEWANNQQILLSVRSHASNGEFSFSVTRLLLVDIESGEKRSVFSPKVLRRADWVPQLQDQIVDLLSDDPDHILMTADLREFVVPDVYRVGLSSGKVELVKRGRPGVLNWLTDRQNRVRIGVFQNETQFRIYEQDVRGKNWRMLWEFQALSKDYIDPLGFGADPNQLYINAYHRGRLAVFSVNLNDPDLSRELIYADDQRDVEGQLIYSETVKDVVGIHTGLREGYVLWSEPHRRLVRSIDAALPHTRNKILNFSDDEQRIVVLAENATNAGTYYVLRRDENRMTEIAQRYETLPSELMVGNQLVEFSARDGEKIQAFLTLPAGTEPSALPVVVLPHGGPISADSGGFDYWTQLFANRGYAVIQINFRGSSGYGYDFMAAGLQAWGLQMQDDVTDGTQWLINQGVADPDRICIVGGSYGGYAALMGAAKAGHLYRCAVSFAGVADLKAHVRQRRGFLNAEVVKKIVGETGRDLRARSPITKVDQIDIPVLLIHGDEDVRVAVDQSRRMYRALKKSGKEVRYVEQKNGGHFLSTNEQRLNALLEIERFLDRHLRQTQ